jgi:adenine deaminase
MVTLSEIAKKHALTVNELRKLLRRKEVIGLGEPYWAPVLEGDQRIFDLIRETIRVGKTVDGHSSGAKLEKLQAYLTLGISSCHEPIAAEEIKERLRAGLFVFIREGEIRRELETVAKIKEEKIDLRRLGLCSDGLGPKEIINDGIMDFIVQKAINLGFDPITAIQMATINPAQRFGLDDIIVALLREGADINIIPDVRTINLNMSSATGAWYLKKGNLAYLQESTLFLS